MTNNKKGDAEIVSYFMRHLVPVAFTFSNGQDIQNFVMTSFVLSVSDKWFLVTAGHCLNQIDELTKKHHYEIRNCVLIDSLGIKAKHRESIPFYYLGSNPTHLNDDNFDYGYMELSPLYRKLLEKNKIIPLNEQVWKLQPSPSEIDFYALLGLPSELSKFHSESSLEVNPSLYRVTPLNTRPAEFPITEYPLFYGSISLGEGNISIKGMSGGPIFGFRQEPNGQLRYWLIALQSTWLTQKKYICGCPTKLLGDTLEKLL